MKKLLIVWVIVYLGLWFFGCSQPLEGVFRVRTVVSQDFGDDGDDGDDGGKSLILVINAGPGKTFMVPTKWYTLLL